MPRARSSCTTGSQEPTWTSGSDGAVDIDNRFKDSNDEQDGIPGALGGSNGEEDGEKAKWDKLRKKANEEGAEDQNGKRSRLIGVHPRFKDIEVYRSAGDEHGDLIWHPEWGTTEDEHGSPWLDSTQEKAQRDELVEDKKDRIRQ